MAGICHKLAEWIRSPFSAVVYFQKHFVDDVADTVQRQKEQFNRHAREMQERAIQLHLDELEGKYLCCVCGRPGESREDDDAVYDTFSIVTLPPKRMIEKGLRRAHEAEEEEERNLSREASDYIDERRQRQLEDRRRERERQHKRHRHRHRRHDSQSSGRRSGDFGSTSSRRANRRTPLSSRNSSTLYEADNTDRSEDYTYTGSEDDALSEEPTTSTAVDFYGDSGAAGGGDQPGGVNASQSGNATNNANNAEDAHDFPALDPELVPSLEVRNMMYKIRHAVLNREARTKRKAVHVHRDKGLTKIEESEIDMYSSFFQRPVHGFLCRECHTSARKRLDTVTEQIQTILFKAQHPFLRKVSEKEVSILSSAGQLSAGLVSNILDIQRKWARQQEATAMRASRMRHRREVAEREGGSDAELATALADEEDVAEAEIREKMGEGAALLPGTHGAVSTDAAAVKGTLSDATISSLRTTVKCAVCQRRQSCFFNRVNVLFLCQFCTARDRFYRENAVCINDEPMLVETVHLLTELARYHEGVHRAQELRQLPQTELDRAPVSLFNQEESLFKIQTIAPQLLPASAAVPPVPHEGNTDVRGAHTGKPAAVVKEPLLPGDDGEDGIDKEESVRPPVLVKVEPRPYVNVHEMQRREADARLVVGTTQLSLFENTKIEPVAAMNLFVTSTSGATTKAPAKAPSAAMDDLFGTALQPPSMSKSKDLDDLFAPAAAAAPSSTTPTPSAYTPNVKGDATPAAAAPPMPPAPALVNPHFHPEAVAARVPVRPAPFAAQGTSPPTPSPRPNVTFADPVVSPRAAEEEEEQDDEANLQESPYGRSEWM